MTQLWAYLMTTVILDMPADVKNFDPSPKDTLLFTSKADCEKYTKLMVRMEAKWNPRGIGQYYYPDGHSVEIHIKETGRCVPAYLTPDSYLQSFGSMVDEEERKH